MQNAANILFKASLDGSETAETWASGAPIKYIKLWRILPTDTPRIVVAADTELI